MRTLALGAIVAAMTILRPSTSAHHAEQDAAATARHTLAAMAGSWSIAVYLKDSTHAVRSGHEAMTLLGDSLKVAWTDTYAGHADTSMGFLGYDRFAARYYQIGVTYHGNAPKYLLGKATGSGILFDPAESPGGVGNEPGTYIATVLRVVDANHFEWRSVDGRRRVTFTRETSER
jgi:hypothetical protein